MGIISSFIIYPELFKFLGLCLWVSIYFAPAVQFRLRAICVWLFVHAEVLN